MSKIAKTLGEIGAGRACAADLLPLVYDELRRLAAARLAHEAPGQTLDPTALVHEAFLRLGPDHRFDHRGHFFSAAAEVMRRILVDAARRKMTAKHGGHAQRHDADEIPIAAPALDEDLIALDEALAAFAAVDPRKAELVKLRYFVGMTLEDAADALGISLATAKRHWAYSRAWLYQRISGSPAVGGEPPGGAEKREPLRLPFSHYW